MENDIYAGAAEAQQLLHQKYMRRCLQLARNGQRNAKPNPMVGAVIVFHATAVSSAKAIMFTAERPMPKSMPLPASGRKTNLCSPKLPSTSAWNPVRITERPRRAPI